MAMARARAMVMAMAMAIVTVCREGDDGGEGAEGTEGSEGGGGTKGRSQLSQPEPVKERKLRSPAVALETGGGGTRNIKASALSRLHSDTA